MILVFAELGGDRLLGKAREIADSLGIRVLAICYVDVARANRLVSLGADEVISYNAKNVYEWSRVLSYLIRNTKEIRFVFLPATLLGNAILGFTYALVSEMIGSFFDSADKMSEQGVSKSMYPSGVVIKSDVSEKVSLWSLKLNLVPEPFEDSSRYGKVTSQELPKEAQSVSPPTSGPLVKSPSTSLTVLAGREFLVGLKTEDRKILEGFAKKYSGRLVEMNGRIENIYGPCVAIEVQTQERGLPEFQSDVLSLNSSEAPISKASKLYAMTPNVLKVVEEIIKSR
jgi:hypothetical protein